MTPAIALLAALLGACGIATGTVLQQRAGQEIDEPDSTRTLLVRVLRRRRWWTGQAVIGAGWLSYAFALHIGPVALVQPVLVTGLVFGTIASARLARRRLDRRLLGASAACVVGLTAFLAIARPQAPAVPPAPAFLPLFGVAVVAGVLGAVGLRAVSWGEPTRAALLALATGGFYGLTATLFSTALREPGLVAALTTWYAAGAVVTSLCGWALSQRALHLGRLNAPVNAVIGTTDPAVAVLLGVLVLGERVAAGPADLVGEVVAAAVVVLGTVVITRQSAAVLRDDRAGMPTPAWG
ncbi:DMT family transporter [Actinomycetospora sp. TBRC 11914]|uniref:DMT family transporter n=1 Tax=Actinomycetospora sp. TBRC 11914 TaxID=2729387 RepID=UPI00145F8887|nr:DMT family transporter [Actinomycetospora sp. TBRC 11914]NMO92128.1 DMT family transporter [Actinomycetospora sp. TBRC 11914]